MATKLTPDQRNKFVRYLKDSFSSSELDDVCFALGVDPSDFGSGASAKSREVILWAERRGKVDQLFQAILEVREGEDLSPYGYVAGGESAVSTPTISSPPVTTPTTPTTPPVTTAVTEPSGNSIYANFDIRIGLKQADGRYPLTAESLSGETKTILQTLPSNSDEFQDYITFLRDLIARDSDAEGLGTMLRQFLFPQEVWDLFGRSYTKAKAEGKPGLRVRLRMDVNSPELSQVPWEYCRDDRSFLALNDDTPVVRYIPTDRPPEAVATPQKVRILLVMASPKDQAALDVAVEEQRIRQALTGLAQSGRVEIQTIPHATRRELRVTCRKFDPHILHFIGHGTVKPNGEGALALEGDSGETQLIDSQDMYLILQGSSTRLVVLNACQTAAQGAGEALSGMAPRLVVAGVPAVIAMQFVMPDKTAVAFTRDFYDFLASGKPLDSAVTEARIGIYVDNDDKVFWAIPVLFMRAPDGVIWQ